MSQKVLVISGSDRNGSFNTQLAEQLVEALENEGQSAEVYDFSAVPLLSQNSEFPAPASVEKLRTDIANAAGLILVSPEYNGSYPARLKNLIDWASRAVIAGDNTTPPSSMARRSAWLRLLTQPTASSYARTCATWSPTSVPT